MRHSYQQYQAFTCICVFGVVFVLPPRAETLVLVLSWCESWLAWHPTQLHILYSLSFLCEYFGNHKYVFVLVDSLYLYLHFLPVQSLFQNRPSWQRCWYFLIFYSAFYPFLCVLEPLCMYYMLLGGQVLACQLDWHRTPCDSCCTALYMVSNNRAIF